MAETEFDYLHLLGAFSGVTGAPSYTPRRDIATRADEAFASILRSSGLAAALMLSQEDRLRRRVHWRDFADMLGFPQGYTTTDQITSGLRTGSLAVEEENIQVALVAYPDKAICETVLTSIPLGIHSLSLALARTQGLSEANFISAQEQLGVTRTITNQAQMNAARIRTIVSGFRSSR
ncbi:MAG: hypothetical protein KGJ07_06020 [Patescibacteria group bacterium]|nr:hypothetical protein [Patescibacteria group bacterium]MDE2589275.1 hypothetical protein [Patescibacteria group bacterium]